jgi:hypothetical protein
MEQYAVLHIDKNKGGQVGLAKHIARETTPLNADPSRKHLNEIAIVGSMDQVADIEKRIKKGVTQKTAVRKDAVKAMQIMLTGSHEQMKHIVDSGQLKEWKSLNLSWLNETFGSENVVNVALHMDEETPHLHATVTPITNDGRLCAKEFMTKLKLKNYQTEYAKRLEKLGLMRGIEGSKAKHQDIQQYYKKLNFDLPRVNEEVKAKTEKVSELNRKIAGFKVKEGFKNITEGFSSVMGKKSEIEALNAKILELTEKNKEIVFKANKTSVLNGDLLMENTRLKNIKEDVIQTIQKDMLKRNLPYVYKLNTEGRIEYVPASEVKPKERPVDQIRSHDKDRDRGFGMSR